MWLGTPLPLNVKLKVTIHVSITQWFHYLIFVSITVIHKVQNFPHGTFFCATPVHAKAPTHFITSFFSPIQRFTVFLSLQLTECQACNLTRYERVQLMWLWTPLLSRAWMQLGILWEVVTSKFTNVSKAFVMLMPYVWRPSNRIHTEKPSPLFSRPPSPPPWAEARQSKMRNLKKYVPWWGHACVEFHDCSL